MASSVANLRTQHHQKKPGNAAASAAVSSRGGVSKSGDGQGQVSSVRTPRSATATTPPPTASRRSATPTFRNHEDEDQDSVRVRVAVRLRPKTPEDLLLDADYADCVELQPEMKRLKLIKNNWNSESYRFDEVFAETASQKRVYEGVAKPVVESVLNGYNGTIMAYGQTGTGKTYTVGRLGKEDASQRGIMVRALEDILDNISHTSDSVEVSYLQLYMESIQDLLSPEKTNIPITEDPKTGVVSLPGATVASIPDLDRFLELLQIGEANRHASNTKLNTESSRSHAILMVNVRRSVDGLRQDEPQRNDKNGSPDGKAIPMIRKSKLLIVDLAGSERIDKSGSEGHLLEEAKFINLSLTSLGKCINALAENNAHIPTRESKLTRLLRDSFGGTARTSLIITIGPSARNHAETTSTILFGQRAMKIVNMIKLKEEFDYESLCRKLENQTDHLTAEIERQQKFRENEKCELERQLMEFKESFYGSEQKLIKRSESLEKENSKLKSEVKDLLTELNHQKDQNDLLSDQVAALQMKVNHSQKQQVDISTYQNVLADTTQMYEKKVAELIKQLEEKCLRTSNAEEELFSLKKLLSDQEIVIQGHEKACFSYEKTLLETTQTYDKKMTDLTKQLENKHSQFEAAEEQLDLARKLLSDHRCSVQGQKEVDKISGKLEEMYKLHEDTLCELETLQSEYKDLLMGKVKLDEELHAVTKSLLEEEQRRKNTENELVKLKKFASENQNNWQDKHLIMKEISRKASSLSATSFENSNASRETQSSQRILIAKICEEVGFERMLALIKSEDIDVQIHAVKVIANLAAEDTHQEKIVEQGGLEAMLMLLRSSPNTTVLRVAAGAIANLAMNVLNQGLIMSKGGAQLLANTASKTDDPQTLRMVAGAIANLCGNERLHVMLKEDGAIEALLLMARCGNSDVIAQVARGIANFAKCESRVVIQGNRKGHSLLLEDGTLTWLLADSNHGSSSIRRHVELALCHLAQNKENWKDFISNGAVKELERISVESTREDIQNLAKKALRNFDTYQGNTIT